MTDDFRQLLRSARPAIVVAGVALLVQAAYLWEGVKDPTFLVPIVDAGVYHDAAVSFASGGPLADGPFWQPPLWPALLGVLYRIVGPSVLAAKLMLAMMAIGSCLLAGHLASRLFSPGVGTASGMMLALYGPFVFLSTQLVPTGLCVLLLLLSILLLMRAMDRPGWGTWSAFGAVCGLAVLTVPNTGVVLLCAMLWLVGRMLRRQLPARAALHAIAALAGFALILAPVAIRNYLASPQREFVLISTNGGVNLYIGNNPRADAIVAIRPGEHWKRLTREPLAAHALTPAAQNAWFKAQVRDYARGDPAGFLRGLARKLVAVVNAREIPRNVDLYAYREHSRVLSALIWRVGPFSFPLGLVAPLAAVGILVARSFGPHADALRGRRILLALIAAGYAVSVALFFVASRHRLPAAVLILPFAAAGAAWIMRQLQRGPDTAPPGDRLAAAGVFVLAAVVVNLPIAAGTDGFNFRAEMLMCVAHARTGAGDLDAADRLFAAALAADPSYAAAWSGWARVAGLRGDAATAEERFRRAIELDPDTADARSMLAQIHVQTGRLDEAVELFEAALERDPYAPPALRGLSEALCRQGDEALAGGDLRAALRLFYRAARISEASGETLNKAAWHLATCPEEALRDGPTAVEFAERLCAMTKGQHAVSLDTLAAAYAACRRFDEAVAAAREAINVARRSGDTAAVESIEGRLRQYETHPSGPRRSEPRP